TAFRQRWRVLRERVLAMKEIWTKEEAEFHGQYVHFDKLWSYPKPVQQPHPPILMGGYGPTTFSRVIEYCDGWLPGQRDVRRQQLAPAAQEPEDVALLVSRVRELRRLAQEAGRDS